MKIIAIPFKSLLIASIFLVATVPTAFGQNNIGPAVDAIVSKAMTDDQIPGAAVAVIQEGKVIYKKTYGIKSVDNKVPPDENSVFSIGSVSKAFTAVGLMELVQQNKIALDDPINKYMEDLPADWGAITIRQFMTHTSGIPELKGAKDDDSFDQTLKSAASLKMPFKPGKKQQYNNFNFAIMGKLIEKVSGTDYMTYMQQHVFGPAGMATTGVKPPTDNVTTGHMPRNGKIVSIITHFNVGDYGVPSGGLQTTLADFIKLSNALYKNLLISNATKTIMWTPYSPRLTNTPGWHSRMAGAELIIHKGGGGTGIGSVCDYKVVPSRNLYLIIMFNKAKNNSSPDDLSDAILQQCFNIQKASADDRAGEGNEQ